MGSADMMGKYRRWEVAPSAATPSVHGHGSVTSGRVACGWKLAHRADIELEDETVAVRLEQAGLFFLGGILRPAHRFTSKDSGE